MKFETYEEANEFGLNRAKELQDKFGRRVEHMLIKNDIDGDNEWILGYLKDPPRPLKMEALDRITKEGEFKSGEYILSISLIREESDPILSSGDYKYEDILMGAFYASQKILKINLDVASKKNS